MSAVWRFVPKPVVLHGTLVQDHGDARRRTELPDTGGTRLDGSGMYGRPSRCSHARRGLNAYPSSASLLMHLLLHAAGGMASQTLRLSFARRRRAGVGHLAPVRTRTTFD
jgi:hypothetical protein